MKYIHNGLLWIIEMSVYSSKPTSFSDEPTFDPNSTPNVNYSVETETETETKGNVPEKSKIIIEPECHINQPPWPTIIISVLGAIIIIYTAIAPNVNNDRRVFGFVLIMLWTIVWALILWVLWKECHKASSWWILLIPVSIMILFFVVIIILNIGSP